jgi:hypothetical protein
MFSVPKARIGVENDDVVLEGCGSAAALVSDTKDVMHRAPARRAHGTRRMARRMRIDKSFLTSYAPRVFGEQSFTDIYR